MASSTDFGSTRASDRLGWVIAAAAVAYSGNVGAQAINYLVLNFDSFTAPQVSLATTCPSGYHVHLFGVDDVYGGYGYGTTGSDANGGSFGVGRFGMPMRVCIAGAPASVTVNTPLSVVAGSTTVPTPSTTLSVAGPTTTVTLAPWRDASGTALTGLVLPDGFAMWTGVLANTYPTYGFGNVNSTYAFRNNNGNTGTGRITMSNSFGTFFQTLNQGSSYSWYLGGGFETQKFHRYTIGY